MMNRFEFIEILEKIATDTKTIYVYGGVGGAMHTRNKARALKRAENIKRASVINSADDNTFGFDCVGLVKGVLRGWCGDTSLNYGGATMGGNGIPDVGADAMMKRCLNVSTDFRQIVAGAFVWMSGHCGVYIGNGLVVESTPKWDGGVQISTVENLGAESDKSRKWSKWGLLPEVDYNVPYPVSVGYPVWVSPDMYADGDRFAACVKSVGETGDGITIPIRLESIK